MAQTVFGIFDSAQEARMAAEELLNNGFSRDSIDISAQDTTGNTDRAKDADNNDDDGISNFFRSLFGSDDEAERHARVARRGSVLTVHVQSREEAERATAVLDQYGAIDVNERAMQYRNEGDTSIPIIEEHLNVGKRVVETGGVRLRSRIIEHPVEEHIRLREEHVRVTRNPVNRKATDADLANFKEGEMEVTEHAEVPVVDKEEWVVEEVSLSKEVEEHDETIRDTVRKTDVEAEKIEGREARNRDRNRNT